MDEEFRLPLGRRLTIAGILAVGTVGAVYLVLGGHRVEVVGFDPGPSVIRPVLVTLAALGVAMIGYEAGKLLRGMPDASVTEDGFVVRQFPRARSVRWRDVAWIEEPAKSSLRFGNSITWIVVGRRDGTRWRFIPPCDEDTIPHFHEALVASWRRATS